MNLQFWKRGGKTKAAKKVVDENKSWLKTLKFFFSGFGKGEHEYKKKMTGYEQNRIQQKMARTKARLRKNKNINSSKVKLWQV